MRKRLSITIISITLVALMVCGWTAYAATSPNTAISTSIIGIFKSIQSDAVTLQTDNGDQTVPLAKSIWVYRNDQKSQLTDLQSGDRIEIIVNSKNQAAYVKAISSEAPVTPTVSEPTPTQKPAAVVSKPVPTTQPPAEMDKEVYPDLEDIDLKVDGRHFKLHIIQTKGANSIQYDLSIKPENAGTIHLKGDQAANLIKMLLTSIDLKSSDAEKVLAQQLAEHYGLDASKLNVQMKTKWDQKDDDDEEDDKDEDNDEDKDDSKNKDQNKDKVMIKTTDSNKAEHQGNDKDDNKNDNNKYKPYKNKEQSGKHDDHQKKQRGSSQDD